VSGRFEHEPGGRRCSDRRLDGERGAGLVVGITLMFAFTFLGLVWLARDVDRAVSNRSAAQAIAFQSARAGAQAAFVSDLRQGGPPTIDEAGARGAVASAAARLLSGYGLDGNVTSIVVGADEVTVAIVVRDGGHMVSGVGTVRAERVP
jgi:hypothetical protein